MLDRSIRVAASVFCLVSGAAYAALMQHSETTIPIPKPGEKTELSRLEYRARFVASIDAVTLDVATPETAAPVIGEWTFLGSNTDGQAHRVEIALRFLDEGGSQVAVYSTRAILPAGAAGRPVRLTTKVKPEVWKAAKKVRIFAEWMS